MKKTKRIIIVSFTLIFSLLAIFVSSQYIGKGLFKYFTKTTENPNKLITTDIKELGYESVSTKIIHEQLTEEEKDLYDLISKKVTSISNAKNADGFYKIDSVVYDGAELSGFSILKVVSAFVYENPDVFWLRNVYSYHTLNGKTTIELSSHVSLEECSQMSSEIIDVINKFSAKLKNKSDEYETEKVIFNFLTENCVYDTSIDSGVDNWKAYTIYGALVEGKAVCEGYAKAALKLFNLCGVDSVLINGYTPDHSAHMWNMVNINDKWYHLDVTGCDNETIVTYKYFNLTDIQIEKNYIVSSQYEKDAEVYSGNFILPKAYDESLNFYKKEGFVLSGLGNDFEKDLSIEIISAAQKNKNTIHLYIDKNLDFTKTVSRVFTEYPFFFSKCLVRAEDVSRYTFDSENIQYVYDETTRGISVKLF